MQNNNSPISTAIHNYLQYIETTTLPPIDTPENAEIVTQLKQQLTASYHLLQKGDWKMAFEDLSTMLIEKHVILDKQGIEQVKTIIPLGKLNPKWQYTLRRIHSLGYIMGSWTLVDAEKIAQANKYTFEKPSQQVIQKLKVGNYVKLIFNFESTNEEHPSAERMWVIITAINNDKFTGKLDNDPFFLHELFAGDQIHFEHQHIISHDLDIDEPSLVEKYINRCLIPNKILYENAAINFLYRESPMEKSENHKYDDSGWRIFTGNESDDFLNNPENLSFVSLGAVLSKDDSFVHLLDAPIGACYQRNEQGGFDKVEQ